LKRYFLNVFMFAVVLLTAFSLFSCSKDDTSPTNSTVTYDQNTINGTISFVDTGYVSDTTVGKYYVSVFGNWPGNPNNNVVVKPVKSNGKYSANYKISVPNDGDYTVAIAWVRVAPSYKSWFLGVYDVAGKDTSRTAIWGPHPKVTISGGVGVGNINFNSYLDTLNNIAVYP
jgi:hypothetical protein